MLQQTQAGRVVPKWSEFIARWPTPADCAAAPASDVVRAWSGLGYNRRALNLHRCATEVVARHGGQLPGHENELRALPGIGPYTARAVLAFAFGHDVAALDTNITRVVTRAAIGQPASPRDVQAVADKLIGSGEGWAWNQAAMDLGAGICTARQPRCQACPLNAGCRWRRHGGPDPAARRPRQKAFQGSDRQGRGRLLAALSHGPVDFPNGLGPATGWPDDAARAERVAQQIVSEGFATVNGAALVLS